MGCDIHCYREKLVNGQWVTADEWENCYGEGMYVPWEKRFTDRNYNLFSVLADVRTRETPPYQFEARGLPLRPCQEVARLIEEGSVDHSASHLYLFELVELRDLMAANTIKVSGMKDRDQLAELRTSIASGKPNWDLLYPYCQGTSDPKQVEFEIDVPGTFIVGAGLDKLIASLQEIGGDNQRMVFWFDN